MPNFDQTGPMGEGSMTGRKMGKCSKNESEKTNFWGKGCRGKGRGVGRGSNCGSGNQNRFRGGN